MPAPQVVYTVIDDKGKRGTTSVNIPTGFSISQITEFGAGMATFIDAVLAGKVETAELVLAVDISALTSNVGLSTADSEEVGAFEFVTQTGFRTGLRVPAIDELMVLAGSDALDTAHADISAFIAAMENGVSVTGGTISPTDIAEGDIDALVNARERFRASGTRR